MESYKTVAGEATAEYSEKRSRFIAVLRHTKDERAAMEFVDEVRAAHRDARHNCFAYSVSGGIFKRYSDDGEPHGTAGKPMLDILDGAGLTGVTAVVTRYFGGVLLGTGGLVRAYSSAVKSAVAAAKIVKMTPCTVYVSRCAYADRERLFKLIEDCGGTVENTVYTAEIELFYFFPDSRVQEFLKKLTDTFSARITAEEQERKMLPTAIGEEK